MANKQINELTEKTDQLDNDDLILLYDSEEAGSEKTKKVPISNYVGTITSIITLYVATTGNDSTGNGTSGNPWLTIGKALTWLQNKFIYAPGGTVKIQLADGTYNGLDNIYFNNIFGKRITIEGNTTTPANVTLNFNSGQNGILVPSGGHLNLKGVKMVGGGSQTMAGLQIYNNSFGTITQCVFDNWAQGIYTVHGSGAYVFQVTVNNNSSGVLSNNSLLSVSESTLSNNVNGANATWNGSVVVYNSTFSGNSNNTVENAGGTVTIA